MRVAAVDIGTNTVRLLVADVVDGRIHRVYGEVVVTGLGRGVDATGSIGEEAMARTEAVLIGYAGAVRAHGAESVTAVATSATRDASNGGQFLERAETVLGTPPRVITGDEEARLSFRGVVAALDPKRPVLVIDPGGGSTEFVLGDAEPGYISSVDIGSVRLTERRLPDHPARREQVAAAVDEARRLFAPTVLPRSPGCVVGVGGTYTALAAIALDLPAYDRDVVHRTELSQTTLDALVDTLAVLTVEETAAIPSLDPARAPVLLGGAVVAAEALRHVGASRLMISESDILDGLALEAAEPG